MDTETVLESADTSNKSNTGRLHINDYGFNVGFIKTFMLKNLDEFVCKAEVAQLQ